MLTALAQSIVTLPEGLQIVLATAVLFAVRALLAGRIPEDKLFEIATALTTALITVIGVTLSLIPLEFEAIANVILQLLLVLIGGAFVVFGYLKARANGFLK